MHCASESIGAIATALAKAQAGLSNPERTLTATIFVRDSGRIFAMLHWRAASTWYASASASTKSQ